MLDLTDFGDYWRVLLIESERSPYDKVQKIQQLNVGPVYDSLVINNETWRRKYGTFEGLPPKTQFAVSALTMCANTERIEGIGQKVSTTTFWLESTPEIIAEYELPEYNGRQSTGKDDV
jgi:hypothetical protein